MKTDNQFETESNGPKIYTGNMGMFEHASKSIITRLGSTANIILDLGNDKRAQFARYLAGEYADSLIVNFRDIKTFGASREYKLDNLKYVEQKGVLAKWDFNLATAFLSLHEYLEEWRVPELEILYKNLSSGGLGFVLDYEAEWTNDVRMDDQQFIKEVFTEGNERKMMRQESDCRQRHTSYGSKKCIEDLTQAGFKNIVTAQYHIKTSFGVHPKFFTCIGEKV